MLARLVLLLGWLLAASAAFAQVEVALSPQPEDIFKTVFGSSGEGYCLLQADVCTMSEEPVTVHAGIAVRISAFISITGAIITASDTVRWGDTVRAAFPVVANASEQFAHELVQDLPDTSIIQATFLNGIMELSAGACDYKLVMSKDTGDRDPIIILID